MITLKNGTKGISQIGYLAKISTRDGYFEVAGIGDNVIGVISESVIAGAPCNIITNGEALIYLHKRVRVGKYIRQQEVSDGAVKGRSMPSTDGLGDNVVARATEDGVGLVKATVMLSGALNVCFGSMYNFDTTTVVTVASKDVWYQVPSGFVVGEVNNMIFQNARELVVGSKGYYQVIWATSFTAATGNIEIEGTIMVNGVANTNFAAHRLIGSGTDTGSMAGVGILSLNAGDIISLCMLNETNTSNINVEHSNSTVVRVG